MPNEQNLKPFTSDQSREKAAENGRKGGIASGESKRRRKTLKEELLLMLENEDIQRSVAAALINEATEGNNAGSVARAFETIRDTIGEKPVDKLEMKAEMNVEESAARLRSLFESIKKE